MVILKPTFLSSFKHGFCNAVTLKKQLSILRTSYRTREIMLKAVILNGVFWLGSLYLIDYLFSSLDNHHIHGLSYKILTGYPLYLFCLIINSRLFDQIAKSTLHLNRPSQLYNESNSSTKKLSWYSTIYILSFYGNCTVYIFIVRLIPFIGSAFGFFFNSIILAYYCFEYKWIELGWTQEHRMSFVEQHWPYFFGFGLPVTCLTYFLSTLHAGAIFSLFYPSVILE